MHQRGLVALAAMLASIPAAHSMYNKNSPVLQVTSKTYSSLIAQSNHTSIVEFYAPWCGHCKNLKPAYENAAKKLDGLAKVAAVDCDDDANKQLCGAMDVKGFPTLKIVRPGKKANGKPVVEDYQGPRTATGIVEAVVSRINNHVARVSDKDLDKFLESDKPKAILFTDKGTTSALLRSIAIDFLDVITVGQVRDKEKKAVDKFGIAKFPTLVLVPAGTDAKPIVYDGELKKKDMVEFLKQVGEPNPDPAPPKAKGNKKPKSSEKPDEPEQSTESPKDDATAKSTGATPEVIAITTIATKDTLAEKCLHSKAHTCILAFIPSDASEKGDKVTASLSQINTKYVYGHRQLFPFLAIPSSVEGVDVIRKSLDLKADVELIAVNARRAWWRHYEGDFGAESVESWIDAIRMGEGAKKKLPKEIIVDSVEKASSSSSASAKPDEEAAQEKPADEVKHEEL
ncbi:uncharacterized protein UV8b_01757 [Ustilaginoidea virens]|uniref:protein disulfide-isomerase n=1 Tax=Ustilaginoidea virens TaxID=1159556 RepID=A0A063BPL2_USTVR|nr:uncharacterized protein UV8b_01757 [Ustilaginoidea virens]QUC17516.1 hypothetical protein UV8b_01757 [Ustilaginoidea virens]GAO13624.1 hypothetical protein UVI_02017330 [Ustilaginoidea virens]